MSHPDIIEQDEDDEAVLDIMLTSIRDHSNVRCHNQPLAGRPLPRDVRAAPASHSPQRVPATVVPRCCYFGLGSALDVAQRGEGLASPGYTDDTASLVVAQTAAGLDYFSPMEVSYV
jgi:hypothetical protein